MEEASVFRSQRHQFPDGNLKVGEGGGVRKGRRGRGGKRTRPARGPKRHGGNSGKSPGRKKDTSMSMVLRLLTRGPWARGDHSRYRCRKGSKVLPEVQKGCPGGVWVQDPLGPSGFRTLSSDTGGGGGVPTQGPPRRGFF